MESCFVEMQAPVLAMVLAATCGGCSGGSTSNPPTWKPTLNAQLRSSASDALASVAATSPLIPPMPDAASTASTTGLGAVAAPLALSVRTQPWAVCAISANNASTDPVHTATAVADGDGELRFFAPPSDWGTRLTLQCSLGGTSQPTVLVDTSDSSTFTPKLQSDLEPELLGIRPALTGDLSSVSNDNLLRGGYPPRPDPVTAPQQYAKWASV